MAQGYSTAHVLSCEGTSVASRVFVPIPEQPKHGAPHSYLIESPASAQERSQSCSLCAVWSLSHRSRTPAVGGDGRLPGLEHLQSQEGRHPECAARL